MDIVNKFTLTSNTKLLDSYVRIQVKINKINIFLIICRFNIDLC